MALSGAMLDYVTLGSNDLGRARAFYEAVLQPLGYRCLHIGEAEIGFGAQDGPSRLWVLKPFSGAPATVGNGVDVAFLAPTAAAVDAFHAAALAEGGSDEGLPGPRPNYGPNFYTAYVRDLDGNKLNAVFRGTA